VVRADDLRVRALAERQVLRRLAADVGAEVVEEALLAQQPKQRELQRLRDQRQPEVEVEDVRAGGEAREGGELRREPLRERAVPVERPVRLVVEPAALEDDEPRVDALAPQRLDVLPRDAGDVDRAVRDAQRPRRGRRLLWIVRHAFVTSFGEETWRV